VLQKEVGKQQFVLQLVDKKILKRLQTQNIIRLNNKKVVEQLFFLQWIHLQQKITKDNDKKKSCICNILKST
jgi:hypothetical protein